VPGPEPGPEPATGEPDPLFAGLDGLTPAAVAPFAAEPPTAPDPAPAAAAAGSETAGAASRPIASPGGSEPATSAAAAALTDRALVATGAAPVRSDAHAEAAPTPPQADAPPAVAPRVPGDSAGAAPRPPEPLAPAAGAEPARAAAAVERMVALADLPRALHAEVDGFLSVRGRGRHWAAELRLDPPELGAVHVRLELRGDALHGVVRVEKADLEPALERLVKDLEQDLRRQGETASFDLSREPRDGWRGREPAAPAVAWERDRGGGEPRSRGGAGPDTSRLVDLLA